MADRATITIHTTPETRARLEKLATTTRRSKSFLGNEAIERYLAAEEEFIAGVEQGIADADAGRTHSTDAVRADLHAAIDRATTHEHECRLDGSRTRQPASDPCAHCRR